MKIWTSKYRRHWVSPYTIAEKICFWREIDYDEPWVKQFVKIVDPACRAWQWFLDRIHPRIAYVKIDHWDTWSMDHTLAEVILPMLKQLQATKHGAPHVDDDDVPEYLRSYMAQPKEYEWDVDSLHFMRWDWVLNEEIWAFEQLVKDNADEEFFDRSECDDSKKPWDIDYVNRMKYDVEGHLAWNDRVDNGLRLFGKYFRAHWD